MAKNWFSCIEKKLRAKYNQFRKNIGQMIESLNSDALLDVH
jgi:hypothetical protein